MAACGSLHRYFENPMPENPNLIEFESLSSWSQSKPVDLTSFTELFCELQFKENLSAMDEQDPSSEIPQNSVLCKSQSFVSHRDPKPEIPITRKSLSFDFDRDLESKTISDRQSYNLGISNYHCICTEGLGFESCDDLDDSKSSGSGEDLGNQERFKLGDFKSGFRNSSAGGCRKLKTGGFPPPISCIGRNGQPWVRFKSYRHDGRFVLREYRIPSREFLHASREDGRLKLHLIQRGEEVAEEGEEEGGEEGH